jgi:hypothetical protein
MEQTMTQYIPFALMILYALILLLIAKPLDNWRESRLSRKTKLAKQGELFDSRKKVNEERPLVSSPR